MTPIEIKTGDTLLIMDKKAFISKTIVKTMKKWTWKKYKVANPPIVLSHAARFAKVYDTLYVYGSIDSVYKPWEFDKHYSFEGDEYSIVIMRRKTPLTPEEEITTFRYIQNLTAVSFTYQYTNFIKWLALVYLNINLFKISDKIAKLFGTQRKITYCYESEYMCRKELNPENYGETYQVDFFMLINDPNYEIIYKSLDL